MVRRLMECLEGLRAQPDSPGPTASPGPNVGPVPSAGNVAFRGGAHPENSAARSPVVLRCERMADDIGSGRVLAAIDKKIIPKPPVYSGAVREYVGWNDSFKDFLETQDERWRPLLEEIEKIEKSSSGYHGNIGLARND